MHTAYKPSRRASDRNPIFGAQHWLEGNIRFVEVAAGRSDHANDSLTQHLLSSLQARSRVKELVAADRNKDEYLAVVCHELRNPIAALQNAVSILRAQTGEDAALLTRIHALIDRQLGNMSQLAESLLDVSRIARGGVRLKRERLDLREIVRAAVETLQANFAQRGHRLTVTLPDGPVWLQADGNRLGQVFVNLLANGSKYMDVGGELGVSVQAHADQAIVRVWDAGIGISREMLPHVFDLFVQADAASKHSGAGLGIGLALVRMLVELHGGTVCAASAGLGRGSEFTVRLPQAP